MSLLGGVEHGLQAGIQYIVDIARLLNWAVGSGNAPAIHDCVTVMMTFEKEVVDTAGQVTTNAVGLIVGAALGLNGDPNAGSRHLAQAALLKWGHH